MKIDDLTKAEEQVMQYLWKIQKGFLKDIIEQFPEPKPAYTTVSTVVRVLVNKKFIAYNTYGKIHEYFPLVSKELYFQNRVKPIISNYFEGSPALMASCFANEKMDLTELNEIKRLIEQRINKLKSKKS